MLTTTNSKLGRILCCPNCKSPDLHTDGETIRCSGCGELYSLWQGTPILIKHASPVLAWYKPLGSSARHSSTLVQKLSRVYWWIRPDIRIWTKASLRLLQRLLAEGQPDAEGRNVVLIGTGFESVYRRALQPYKDIMRIGLATHGEVDVLNDICDMPLMTDSVDLLLSSSVLEHVYDPERAVAEMSRVLKPGGSVYAEIPFMRAFHMIPVDYQRYTLAGIEALFERHGFALTEKGICSGPFTAWVLFHVDFIGGLLSFNKYLKAGAVLVFSVLLHPIKYLDRLVESAEWAQVCACNFYYAGRKAGAGGDR
jgi:SAM-dependent methyltransferase